MLLPFRRVRRTTTRIPMVQKKVATAPDQLAKALAMREAGFTVLAIAQRLGMSERTLHRQFTAHGAKKGKVDPAMVEAARLDLLEGVTSDEAVRREAARLVSDDLAHTAHLRDLLAAAAEKMTAATLADAVLVMRAAAAYSTALKNTSDMLRHSLRADKVERGSDELPTLVVRSLSAEEIAAMRAAQTDSEFTSADDDVEEELVADDPC